MADPIVRLLLREGSVTVSTFNLNGGTDGFYMAHGGWTPSQPIGNVSSVYESITLRATGTSVDNLAANVQALHMYMQYVDEWKYKSSNRYVVLYVQYKSKGSSETQPREALIKSMAVSPATSAYNYTARARDTVNEYVLTLERVPYWESVPQQTQILPAAVSKFGTITLGETAVLPTGSIKGDSYARFGGVIHSFTSTSNPVHTFWMGWKTDKYGTKENLKTKWSLRLAGSASDSRGSFGTDTTGGTSHADATAVDGYKAVCTFGSDTTLVRRATVTVDDVTTDYDDQRGSYLVLMRAKLTASGEVRARLAVGYADSDNFSIYSRVVIDSTTWYLYEMGVVTLPAAPRVFGALIGLSNEMRGMAIGVDAEQVSGSPSLDMDALILIPYEEGMAKLTGVSGALVGNKSYMELQSTPDGQYEVLNFTKTGSVYVNQQASEPYIYRGIPYHTGCMGVFAFQRETSSVLGESYKIEALTPQHRWRWLRGNS